MQQYRQLIGTLNFWIFLCLIAVLPYTHALIRPLWVIWLISWALELRWIEKPCLSRSQRISLIPVLGIAVWIGWEVCSAGWSADSAATWNTFGRHINLLAVLVISVFGLNDNYKPQTLLRALILTSLISVGFYLLTHYWIDNLKAALSDEWRPDTQLDWLRMDNLTMAMKHRLYYAVILSFALISTIFLLPEHIRIYGKAKSLALSTAASLVLLAGIWWSGSRICMAAVIVCAGIWAIWHTPGRKKWLTGAGFALLTAALAWGALTFYPRFAGQTVDEIFAYHPEQEEPSFEPRVAIWNAALESPQDYILCGKGAGCSKGYMTQLYEAKGWTRLAERQYSPHCQFLTVCIELGGLAAFLFFAIWIILPLCYSGKAREYTLYGAALLILCMLTESMFDRIEGIEFICVMLLIFHRLNKESLLD